MTKPLIHSLIAPTVLALGTLGSSAALAQTAPAGLTRGAVAVTTAMGQGTGGSAVSVLIDQSGLSSSYVSGATAFDAYTASATHNSTKGNRWNSNAGVTTGFLSFDLGATYFIDGVAWFGLHPLATAQVTRMKVYADDDGNATNGNTGLLFDSGTFGNAANSVDGAVPSNVFRFSSGAITRYLDIEIVGNNGASASGLGEVVFRQNLAAVPEPGSYALMAAGLGALGFMARRRSGA